ncbi:MAG TPA: RNA polymerase sigma-70 factor [Gemmatimonadales bacterium]|nr:RNA polymerase sigma-70 factor [Gemmatimonadales bacterium]
MTLPLRPSTSGRAPGLASDLAERDLIARIRAGDAAAFSELFQEHFASLCGFVASYVRTPEAAEELVQDLFCTLWQRRAEWEPQGRVRHYLLAAARNRALSYLRHRRMAEQKARRWTGPGQADTLLPGLGDPLARPDRDVELREFADACHRAIHALPERRRAVVTLRWQHQMTHAEIAHALGISVKGVEMHLTRALKSLRKRLEHFRD